MTHFLTDTCVNADVGYILQIILIIWCFMIWNFYIIYLNRFINKGKYRTSLDILYFCGISITLISECIRVIDPFSINGILSFKVNRIFWIFIFFVGPSIHMLLIDTFFAIIYRIKKQLRPKKYRYMVLSNLFLIQLIPGLIMIIVVIVSDNMDTTILNTIFSVYMVLRIIDFMNHMVTERWMMWGIKTAKTDLEARGDEDADNDDDDDNLNRQITLIMNGEKRLLSSISRRQGFLPVVIGYCILELVNGGIAVDGECFFVIGLLWAILLRMGSMAWMYEAWIDVQDIVKSDHVPPSFLKRMSTGAFIDRIAIGIDLTRLKTISIDQFELEPINQDPDSV